MKRPTLHNNVAWAQDGTFVVLEDEGEAPADEDAVVKRYGTVKGLSIRRHFSYSVNS